MATITFYKTTLDGENYPNLFIDYLIACEQENRDIKSVNPGRESYTIALSAPLSAGVNYAEIVDARGVSFFYFVENMLAPLANASYTYVLTLDKFATAAVQGEWPADANAGLLSFSGGSFYGDGTAARGHGQTLIDAASDMTTLTKNAFLNSASGGYSGFCPLLFVLIDGMPAVLGPGQRMTSTYVNGLLSKLAAKYNWTARELALKGKLYEWTHDTISETTTGKTLNKVEVQACYIIPWWLWATMRSNDIDYWDGYSPSALIWRECTIDRDGLTPESLPPFDYETWSIFSSAYLPYTNLSSIAAGDFAIFGGAQQQAQTAPCGVSRVIKAAMTIFSNTIAIYLTDETGGSVECAGSCRMPLVLPAETKTEEALSKAATIIGTGVSVVGVAGSVATGNPLGIAASAGGLTTNVLGAVRQFTAPPPTATSSGSTFLDLRGEWCPLFVHALRPARPLDLFGFTPPKLMEWENMGKIPSLNHPVFVRGEVSNAKTPFPPSWVNESLANGVRVWTNGQFDTRAEVFQ